MKYTTYVIALLICFGLYACKKDSTPALRTQQYPLTTQNNSGLTGSVTFREINKDSVRTAIDVSLHNAILGGYIVHIHEGGPTSYHVIIYDWGHVYPQHDSVHTTVYLPLPYDSAMNLNGTFVVHDSTESMIVASGGIGIYR